MTLTFSQTMPLGSVIPDFSLPDVIVGEIWSLQALQSFKAIVVMFICNHCPYVRHIEKELAIVAQHYQPQGVAFVAISANDIIEYPEDAPDQMRKRAIELGYSFPYLYDESQAVAKAYGAVCTPEFYVADAEKRCVYHGCFDDSSPGKTVPLTGKDLRAALDAVLAGDTVPLGTPSMGCNIKWKVA